VPALPAGGSGIDATLAVRAFNDSHQANADLWSRARHAADIARHARDDASEADLHAAKADVAHRVIQAEHPERRASRPRQLLLAAATIVLDGVACNFAAQALGDDRTETLIWTVLFLAVLAAGELGLDVYQGRQKTAAWRFLAWGMGAFVVMLGLLRYSFLITVGPPGQATALTGATLFTAATACFVTLGYRALRAAETPVAWKARRRKLAMARKARATRTAMNAQVARRDRLADAYLSEIRAPLLRSCPASQLPAMEQAVRNHLVGGD
jgi:hypothetical protein